MPKKKTVLSGPVSIKVGSRVSARGKTVVSGRASIEGRLGAEHDSGPSDEARSSDGFVRTSSFPFPMSLSYTLTEDPR